MKHLKLALIGAAALIIATAAPVGAITYGEPDAGEHPYVGLMIFFDPNEPGWFSCSGTLLSATVFLTAGHCTFNIGTDGEAEGTSGGNDVWVTVAPEDVLEGFPLRADYPNEATLYAARSAWLDANPDYVTGTAFPHDDYDEFSGFPANHDVGVVLLDGAGIDLDGNYGELAPIGSVEILIGESSPGLNDALVETVGYGIQAIQPNPLNVDTRYKSTSRIVQNKSSISGGGNLHTLNNPSEVGGVGGSCFGDSGGPVLINNTNQVLAVVSFGFSLTCHGADYSWRVDTQEAYDFVLPFLD